MPKYDGEVRFKYSVDKDGAEKSVDELTEKVQESASASDKAAKGMKKAFSSSIIEPEFKAISRTIDKVKNSFSSFVSTMSTAQKPKISAEEYKEIEKQIDTTEKKLNNLIARQEKFLATGGKTNSKTYKNMQYEIEELSNTLTSARQDLDNFDSEMGSGSDGEGRVSIVNKMIGRFSLLRKAIDGTKNAFTKTQKILSKGISKLAGHFQKNTSKMSQMFSNMGRRFLLNVLVFNVIRKAISSLVQGLKDGVNNLVKQDAALNSSMSAMQSSIIQLKNALGSLASPIIQAVTPAIQSLCAWLTTSINKINQFISAITGKSTWKKATAVQTDYAASLDSTADSADNAAKAEKKQLANFDTLNKLDFSENDSNSGASGGSGNSEGGFTEESIPEDVKSLADQIKETLSTDDWSSIGELIAEKFNGVLKNIPWAKVNSGAQHVASGLATLINGFVEKSDWSLLGQTIGNGINTATGMSYTFLTTTNFYDIGNAIATTLNSAIKTTDFTLIGKTLAAKFNAQLHTIQGFVENFNFREAGKSLGQSINGFIKDVDWKGIGKTIGESFKGSLNFLSSSIQEIDWSELPNDIIDTIEAVDWSGSFKAFTEFFGSVAGGAIRAAWETIKRAATDIGKFVHKGFKDGVWNGFKNIGTWILNNIFKPFINGFKKAFGINSPSTVMKEMGGYIVAGLKEGLGDVWGSVKDKFEELKTKVCGTFTSIKNSLFGEKGIVISLKTKITDAFASMKNNLVGEDGIFNKIKEKTVSIWNDLSDKIKTPIRSILKFIEKFVQGVIDGINGMIAVLNTLHFEIPDWVPGLGGKSFGFNLKSLSYPKFPELATGAVLQPNNPFLAVVGDQKRGVNIETPLETMVQAFETALRNGNYGSGDKTATVIMQVDKQEFGRAVVKFGNKETQRVGISLV